MTTRSSLLQRLKNEGRPLLAYWLMTAYGLTTFTIVALLSNPGGETLLIIAGFVGGTIAGQLLGNLFAYLRPRFWILALILALSCIFQAIFFTALAAAATIVPLSIAVAILPFTLLSGFFAVRYRTEIFGAWVPMLYAVGSAVILINSSDKLATWQSGSKWAVWDIITVPILAGAILLFIVYLVMRQSLALTQWQNNALQGHNPNLTTSENRVYKPRARVSWSTWGCMGILAVALTIVTALLSPYLFRTKPSDGKGGKSSSSSNQNGKGKNGKNKNGKDGKGKNGKGKNGKGKDGKGKDGKGKRDENKNGKGKNSKGKDGKGKGKNGKGKNDQDNSLKPPDPDTEKMKEGMRKTADQAADFLQLLLILLVVCIVLYLVFWRPIRRYILLRHLDKPAWPVPSTQRITDLWRRVLIATHDLQLSTPNNEPTADQAKRLHNELLAKYGKPPQGLQDAAAIYSRVQFGIGLRPEDLTEMTAAVDLFTNYADNQLTPWEQFKNLYRGVQRWDD